MSDLGAIFHVKKEGVQYDAHAYTTLDECPEPNLKLKYKGQQAYVKLETKGSGDVPCYVRTKAGSVFQVKKEAVTYVNVTITQSANQTIHVYTPQKSGGTDHTSSFTIPKGTSYEAEVIPADGYTAGTLNVNAGGRINSNMTFSTSEASIIIPTGRIELGFNTVNFTVPAGITVLYMHNRYLSAYVGVTPNTKHKLYYEESYRDDFDGGMYILEVLCESHEYITGTMEEIDGGNTRGSITIEWSPSINTHSVDVKHYYA